MHRSPESVAMMLLIAWMSGQAQASCREIPGRVIAITDREEVSASSELRLVWGFRTLGMCGTSYMDRREQYHADGSPDRTTLVSACLHVRFPVEAWASAVSATASRLPCGS